MGISTTRVERVVTTTVVESTTYVLVVAERVPHGVRFTKRTGQNVHLRLHENHLHYGLGGDARPHEGYIAALDLDNGYITKIRRSGRVRVILREGWEDDPRMPSMLSDDPECFDCKIKVDLVIGDIVLREPVVTCRDCREARRAARSES